MLLIDKREPEKLTNVIKKVATTKSINFEMQNLDCGDFVFTDESICIERKTLIDLYGSYRDGRIKSQLKRMEGFERPFLIIVGRDEQDVWINGKIVWPVSTQDHAIVSILSKYKTKIIKVKNDNKLIDTIFEIRERVIEGNNKPVGINLIKKSDVVDQNYVYYLSTHGIGEKTAIEIMKKYPKFYDFLTAFMEGTLEVKLRKNTIKMLETAI